MKKIIQKGNSIKKHKQRGFTLIEVVLTTMIISLVFISIYSLISISYKGYVESRYEAIAAGLAQEAIEMVRNYRDEAYLNGASYNITALTSECGSRCAVYYDPSGSVRFDKNTGGGTHERVALISGVYRNCISSCSVSEPNFERVVTIDSIAGTDAVRVQAKVSWDSFLLGGVRKEIVVESILSEWVN